MPKRDSSKGFKFVMFSEFNTRAASLIIEAISIYKKMLNIQDIYTYIARLHKHTHTHSLSLLHRYRYIATDTNPDSDSDSDSFSLARG